MSGAEDRPRKAALATLDAVLGRPPKRLEEAFAAAADAAGLEGRDRGFARLLATMVLRRKGQLDAVLDRLLRYRPNALTAANLLRLGACQLLLLDTPPHAAVATTVALARAKKRPEAGLINAVLRRIASDRPALGPVERNLPGWLRRRWEHVYGGEMVRQIAAIQAEEPPLDLTVPADRDAWAERLGGRPLGPNTVRLEHPGVIGALAGYDEGAWWVQDAAATLPVLSLGDVRGRRVLDAAAAPGGKTAQLAAAGALVTAVDNDVDRMGMLQDNLRRLGLDVDAVVADLKSWQAPAFDVVLLDAPCSATGTIRRHPDIPWHRDEADIRSQAEEQARLLDAAAALIAPGGRLVFATCSLEPEEGEDLTAAWFERHSELRRVEAPVPPPAELGLLPRGRGAWRSLPCAVEGGIDGFYFAHFRREISA